jgi:hypothetical protein
MFPARGLRGANSGMPQPSGRDDGPAPDQRLVRALDHPLRVGFLRLLADREALSPREALGLLEGGEVALSSLAYHVRLLAQLELVEPAGGIDAAGVPFRPTSSGEVALAVLGLPPRRESGG